MTIRPVTFGLAIEQHDGVKWLCRLEHGHSRKLARFLDDAAVLLYQEDVNRHERAMHEMGRLGI